MKYRHRGYKDDEHAKERQRPAAPPKKKDDGMPPRSRLAEKIPSTLVLRCHGCGRQVPAPDSVGAGELCAGCAQPLHCCLNCMKFDPGVPRECRDERVTQAIPGKRAANQCGFFEPKAVLDSTGRRESAARPQTARQAFDDLFKKK